MQHTLQEFIAHARTKGMDHQTIRMLLLSAGWKEKDVSGALVSETLDMPVPVPNDGGGARDAFYHLLTFTTLYSTVISVMVLLFQYLNRLLPDAASRSYEMYTNANFSAIRWPLAVVLVSFPLFMLFSRALQREFAAHPEKLASGIRKWLTYLTLFVTACTIIGDLITLFFYLLDGEYSVRFFLKVLVVLLMSGVPFGYYFSAVRMEAAKYAESPIHKRFFTAMSVIAAAVFVWGLLIVGSPTTGRMQRFDDQRLSDLRQIQNEIVNQVYGPDHWNVQTPVKTLPKPLPADLKTVAANATSMAVSINDPSTGEPYEYVPHRNTYELCATFALERTVNYDLFWNHPAGKKCFTFDALTTAVK